MRSIQVQHALDRFAIAASTLCAVHCLATPLLIALLPVLASTALADESFHRLMLLWVLPSSALALWMGCRRHRSASVLLLVLAGLALIVVAAFWWHALLGETGEKVMTTAGGFVMALGHWRNYRLCRLHGTHAGACT